MSTHANLMSYAYLLQSRAQTAARTDHELNGFARRFPQAIDCLLKLPYWIDSDPTPDIYRGWAHGAYVDAGHSFAALYHLFRVGFYLEAHVLYRHLLEVLVQVRYFASHRDKSMAHFIPPEFQGSERPRLDALRDAMPKRHPVQFRQMFEYLAPGYYEHYYAMDSEFAHGGVGRGHFRHDHHAGVVTLGCQYDEKHAGALVNYATALLYGFLRQFPEAFPKWKANEAGPLYSDALNSLDEILRPNWALHPESRPWLSATAKLTGWSEPTADAVAASSSEPT